jgi:hypothetical protein
MRSSPPRAGRRFRLRAAALAGRSRERGQALLIAVLVLFAVGTLAALFVALIGAQLAQVARQSEMVALRNIAEAGLRLANEQLTYSPAGADWRPTTEAYGCGEGQVTIGVSYGPPPGELPAIQERFLRITSSAMFPDNPFLRHTIIALKPVLLTDYARFITDRFETNRAANLGVTGLAIGGLPREDHVSYIEGPIRSNTDIVWYGQNILSLRTTYDSTPNWSALGILRDDRIEVAGQMFPPANASLTDVVSIVIDGLTRTDGLFDPNTEEEQYDYGNGFPQVWEGEIIPDSRVVLSGLPEVWTGDEYLSPGLAVPRVRPPEIDAVHPDKETNRYLSLTRDGGFWIEDAFGLYYNEGEYGWGWSNYGGIYIDNFDDVQYEHDLEMLRLNWTRSVGAHQTQGAGDLRVDGTARPPAGPADWWDQTGRYYAPPGVEIIIHGEDDCPWFEIVRHDLREDENSPGTYYYWREPNGQPIDPVDIDQYTDLEDPASYEYDPPSEQACRPRLANTPGVYDGNRAVFPFPANGVIYAEGNVRIRGIMPPVRDNQGRSGMGIWPDEAPEGYFDFLSWNAPNGRTRRFDLQIVSGGTIYLEGDLMSPSTAGLTGLVPGDYVNDALYGSRIALLARDYVCVNTTALNPRPRNLLRPVADNAAVLQFYNDLQRLYPPGADLRFARFQGRPATDWGATPAPPRPALPTERTEVEFEYVDFDYRNARFAETWAGEIPTDIRLLLGHSALYAVDNAPGPWRGLGESVDVAIGITGTTYEWDGGVVPPVYTFRSAVGGPDESTHIYNDAGDYLEFLPITDFQEMLLDGYLTGYDLLRFVAQVTPVPNEDNDGWDVRPEDLNYLLGPVAIAPRNRDEATGAVQPPLPVDIDALMYAQNGSWFVIPGRWFNEDPDEFGFDPVLATPGYHEPLNIRLSVYGAITENLPADLGSAADWTSKWCGPLGTSDVFLSYRFDPLLRYPRREREGNARIGYLRFPNFPITSDLVIWGERVTGPAGR